MQGIYKGIYLNVVGILINTLRSFKLLPPLILFCEESRAEEMEFQLIRDDHPAISYTYRICV
jgi:hypothetical protein